MLEELKNRKADGAEKENLGPGDIEMNMTRLKASTCPSLLSVFLSLKVMQQLPREMSVYRLRGRAEFP